MSPLHYTTNPQSYQQQQRAYTDAAWRFHSAEKLKQQGNAEYKAGNYARVIEIYTKAIGECTTAAHQLLCT
jgi:urate oxidase